MTTATTAPATEGGPFSSAAAPVPVQTRSQRPTSYDPADFGAPTGREVNWKHTPLDRLRVLLADDETEPGPDAGVTYETTASADLVPASIGHDATPRGEVFTPEDLPAAIAWKRTPIALHHRIPQGAEIAEPIIVRIQGTGADRHANGHLVIEAMPQSRATIVLEHEGAIQYAQNVEIIVRDDAALTVVSVQRWDDATVHAGSHQARVDRNASLRHIVVTFGGGVVRINPSVELAGAGARADMFGLAFADAGQHLESQVYVHHKGPHTISDVLYKGALQGETARTVWIGDVLIGPDAVGTDSYEANRNLVLTPGARADSIPNLEIETGDIQGAGHASATGRFDDEQLYYLQSRGIDEQEARRMIVLGFLSEVVQKIGMPDLETELVAAIEAELAQGAAS